MPTVSAMYMLSRLYHLMLDGRFRKLSEKKMSVMKRKAQENHDVADSYL